MRDAELRGLERGEDEDAALRRRREVWRRDALGEQRRALAAALGEPEAGAGEAAGGAREALSALLAAGPEARARVCYATLRALAPLWEAGHYDGRARRLIEAAGRSLAGLGEEHAAEVRERGQGFRWLPGQGELDHFLARTFATGAAALLEPERDAQAPEGGAGAACLGWAACALTRLSEGERRQLRARPGATLPLGFGREQRSAPALDAYAPRSAIAPPRAPRPLLPSTPWGPAQGPGGLAALLGCLRVQLWPWACEGLELAGIGASEEEA